LDAIKAVTQNDREAHAHANVLPIIDESFAGVTQMSDEIFPSKKRRGKAELGPENKLLVGRQEAAALLSISQRALDYLVANKHLQVRRIGARVLIPRSELYRFVRGDHPERLAG